MDPIEGRTPAWRHRCPKAIEVYCVSVVGVMHHALRLPLRHGGVESPPTLRDRLSSAVKEHLAGDRSRTGRRASPLKGRKLDMGCRVARCENRSKGPRFHFMCDKHSRLPKKKQLAALEAWKASRA